MLLALAVRDFILVDQVELDFSRGFGALTGETGAGKSILVDALAFVLGERSDTGVMRDGATRAEVVATFTLEDAADAAAWLAANTLDAGDELILRRTLDAGGRSRAWINGTPSTLQQVRELADSLVDIHGQHAHQSLLRSSAQRALLDAHGGLEALCTEVGEAWRSWRDASRQLDAARDDSARLAEEQARLEWQITEIEALAVLPGEWAALEAEHRRLTHASGLIEDVNLALQALREGEASATRLAQAAAGKVSGLLDIDPDLGETSALLDSAIAELDEAATALRRYVDRIELDPQRLAEVEARVEALHGCGRRFRVTPESLPELLETLQQQRNTVAAAADVALLSAQVAACRAAYERNAEMLSTRRRSAATVLADAVSAVMQELALGGGTFVVSLQPLAEGGQFGSEQIEFCLSGLVGNEFRPLAKVASGGELSRISLAIQVVTTRAARVPTLVFDEVDVGIGGGVAEVVGRLLSSLGAGRQVLCVTHLPQVAARAHWQWRVSKEREDAQVRSRVTVLDRDGRVEEIARMLGGVELTPLTRQHAREMLETAG